MAGLTKSQILTIVNRYIGVNGGYLGDFSYRTHADFYPEFCQIDDIDPYTLEGTTRERFIDIISSESPVRQVKIIRGIIQRFPIDANPRPDTRDAQLRSQLLGWADSLELDANVDLPSLHTLPDIAKLALEDAEILIRQERISNAVDRLHTALHDYLIRLCESQAISVQEREGIPSLFKKLRGDGLCLQSDGVRSQDINSILHGCSIIVGAVDPVRNNATLAHPNPELVQGPEAMLVINTIRTLLRYLEDKRTAQPKSS